jgi:uncharacterized membrane protein (DUF2068 family)
MDRSFPPSKPPAPPPAITHFEPLRWIGAYKLLKGLLSLIGGLLVLRLLHRDLPEIVAHWMSILSIRPHSALGHFILSKVIAIHGRQLDTLSALLFGYTVVAFVEGIGLLMRQTWAEWLTVVTTAALIPYEILEFTRRFTWVRATILVLNILVVVYLIWRIRRDRQKHRLLKELVAENLPPQSHPKQI